MKTTVLVMFFNGTQYAAVTAHNASLFYYTVDVPLNNAISYEAIANVAFKPNQAPSKLKMALAPQYEIVNGGQVRVQTGDLKVTELSNGEFVTVGEVTGNAVYPRQKIILHVQVTDRDRLLPGEKPLPAAERVPGNHIENYRTLRLLLE